MTQSSPTQDQYTLYQSMYCPYCIRVLMAMEQMGIDIAIKDTTTDPQAYEELVAGGGRSQVPCLRIEREGGSVQWLYESEDIVRHLHQTFS